MTWQGADTFTRNGWEHVQKKEPTEIEKICLNVAFMLKKRLIKKQTYIQFVVGILGDIQVANLSFLCKTPKELVGDFTRPVCAVG